MLEREPIDRAGTPATTIPTEDVPAAVREWAEPPSASVPRETIAKSEIVNPDPDASRWLEVDLRRMTGKVPHLAERGGAGPADETVITVNEQVTSCPYFDPGDGIWGGVSLGDVVAVFPAGVTTWTPGVVLELFVDAGLRAGLLDARVREVWGRNDPSLVRLPHQAYRRPGEACWAHRSEDFVTLGRMAAEVQLGLGGAAWEKLQHAPVADGTQP